MLPFTWWWSLGSLLLVWDLCQCHVGSLARHQEEHICKQENKFSQALNQTHITTLPHTHYSNQSTLPQATGASPS